jgi:hypothetical protein
VPVIYNSEVNTCHSIVLNPLPFQIDTAAVLARMRVTPGARAETEVLDLIAEAKQSRSPKAMYRMATSTQRTDAVIMERHPLHQPRAAREPGRSAARLRLRLHLRPRTGGMGGGSRTMCWRFYADAMNQAVLGQCARRVPGAAAEAYSVQQTSGMNPGSLGEWPISQQRPLFALIGDVTGRSASS